ncbi:MAG TPA: hypothetical protein VM925_03620 [Labilithrix sp.]|nr:hypothetical protein [Labilithrix sp.]
MTTEVSEAPSSPGGRLDAVAATLPSRGWWLTGVLTLFLALWTIVPWRPAAVSGDAPYLDPSWVVVLHLAFLDGLAFGEDIVFTYGPWGFVATRTYVPGTFGWLLASWIVLVASIWYAAFAVALATMRSALWAALWMSTLVLVVSLGFEAAYMAVAVLFVATAAGAGRSRLLTSATTLLAALLAWLGLVKFTYFGLGTALVVLVSAWLYATRRRIGPALPAYAVAWLALWLLAGQPLGAVPDYAVNGLSVAAGYTTAMALWPNTSLASIALGAAALTVALVVVLERASGRRFPVIGSAYALTMYVAFKAGFVRQDEWHTPIALLAVAVVALVAAALFTVSAATLAPRTRTLAIAAVMAIAVVAWGLAAVPGPAQHVADIVRSSDETLTFFVRPGRAEASRRVGWSTALAEIRRKVPLPPVTGTADLYPDDQIVLVANGLRRLSRPVFQSYSAYTPRLIALNEGQLARDDRPRTIFVALAPIDGRWPSSEDGPNLMTILSDYRLEARTRSYLVFRDARQRGYRLEHLRTVHARLGEAIAVPALASGPVWVSMDVHRTLLGRVEELAFRPAMLLLEARLAGGRRVQHRLVPGVAVDGFLLSPYLADGDALAAMTTADWRPRLAESAVRTITLRAHRDRLHGYARDVAVTFSRVVPTR